MNRRFTSSSQIMLPRVVLKFFTPHRHEIISDSRRPKAQQRHHTGHSILEELPIDIVKDVPLDYMHLVCLGLVHKLLVLWFRGPKEIKFGSKVRIVHT
ncbi:hypothetical protein MRX96_004527 [Rhipicephalus microplus]